MQIKSSILSTEKNTPTYIEWLGQSAKCLTSILEVTRSIPRSLSLKKLFYFYQVIRRSTKFYSVDQQNFILLLDEIYIKLKRKFVTLIVGYQIPTMNVVNFTQYFKPCKPKSNPQNLSIHASNTVWIIVVVVWKCLKMMI